MAFTGAIRRDATSSHRRTESPLCLVPKQLCVSAGSSTQLGGSGFTPAKGNRQMSTLHSTAARVWVPQPAAHLGQDAGQQPRHAARAQGASLLALKSPRVQENKTHCFASQPCKPKLLLIHDDLPVLQKSPAPKDPRFGGEDDARPAYCSSAS